MCVAINIYEATPEQQPGGGRVAVTEGSQGEVYFLSQKKRVQLSKIFDSEKLVSDAIEQLYEKKKVKGKLRDKMMAATYAPLKEAVQEGYSKVALKVEFGTPNYEFLKQLQYNVAAFAAFKNYAQIKEITALLKDENGNLRSKHEFKQKALEVDNKYTGRYLDVEYDTAVRQARSAAQWQKALTTKKLYPNIKYLPSISANKRDEHKTYYGIIRPIEDPIWDKILPINAWGCKCGWEITDDAVTDIPDHLEEPQKGFEFNAGKTGQIFDLKESEYIQSMPLKEQPALIAKAEKLVNFDLAAELPYINVYSSKAGTNVLAHPLAFGNDDFQTALNNARKLANAKNISIEKIEILPTLHSDSKYEVERRPRDKLLAGVKGNHNPDYRIDKRYMDLKEPDNVKAGKYTIQNIISRANEQGDGLVLLIEKKDYIEESDLYHQIFLKYKYEAYKDFVLFLFFDSEWKVFNRMSFLKLYQK